MSYINNFLTQNPNARSIAYLFLSAFLFSIMAACTKILAQRLGTLELTLFRSIITVILVLVSFLTIPLKTYPNKGKPFVLFSRGFFGATALIAYFYNIREIPLATAFTLSQTTPIFIACLSILILKKRVRFMSWVAIFLGFVGVVALYPPHVEHFSFTIAFFGIYSGLGSAFAYLSIAELKSVYEERIVILSFGISGVIFSLIFIPFAQSLGHFASFHMPTMQEWIYIIIMGISATLAQFYLTKAYSNGQATILAPLGYINILFVLIWGVALGDSLPDLLGFMGIFLIVCGGYLSIRSGR